MAKKLSDVEKFFIEAHADDMSAEELAKSLGRSLPTIRTYLKKINKPTKKVPKVKKEKTQGDKSLARAKGIVMMTEASSEQFDETRAKNNLKSQKYKNAVQSIRDE